MHMTLDSGDVFPLHTQSFANARKYRAKSLICADIMLHIFTCSSDKDFVNTEAAGTVIFFMEYKEHFVPAQDLCDVEVMHI